MEWAITVIDPAKNRILFAGKTRDRDEVHQVAAEARRLRPASQILIRHPMGKLRVYDPQTPQASVLYEYTPDAI